MADEITVTVSLGFAKSGKAQTLAYSGLSFDMTGGDYIHGTLTVATSETAIPLGNITTPGYMVVKNLDLTNFVEIRAGTGLDDGIKMKAGEVACFRHTGSAPYAIADTGSCEIEYLLIED